MPPPTNGGRGRHPELFYPNGRRRDRRRARARRRRRVVVGVAVVLIIVGAAIGAGFAGGAADLRENCNLKELSPARPGINTFVYAADGSLLGSIPAEKNREPVPLNRISKWMQRATIAIEDRRFYEHDGVDYRGIARAFVQDVLARRARARAGCSNGS